VAIPRFITRENAGAGQGVGLRYGNDADGVDNDHISEESIIPRCAGGTGNVDCHARKTWVEHWVTLTVAVILESCKLSGRA
jgi:hypothetical protein